MAFGGIVQAVSENGDSTEDPVSVSFASPLGADGNLIVLGIFSGDGPLAAGSGMTEAVEVHDTGQDDATGIYYRLKQSGDGQTWTVDLPATDQYAVVMREYEGPFAASPLDQTGTTAAADDQTTQTVTAAGATSQADELVIAGWGHRTISGDSNSVSASSVNNSFGNLVTSNQQLGSGARKSFAIADKILTATGTPAVTVTFSAATGRTSAVLATFKKAAGGGGGTDQPAMRRFGGVRGMSRIYGAEGVGVW